MQLNPSTNRMAAQMDGLLQPGYENASIRYEIVKRDGRFKIDLVKHWISQNEHLTVNNRFVVCEIDSCLHQSQVGAASIHTVSGAVARCKRLCTETGIPMSVNIPQ